MASIHSEEEHQFVLGLDGGSGYPWLGGRRDPGNRDNFIWSDGTPWDYSNWAVGQPDDIARREDCAHMWDVNQWNRISGLWNDRPCSVAGSFVCKKGRKALDTKPRIEEGLNSNIGQRSNQN